MTPHETPKFLSDKDLAKRFGVARATPWRWIQSGTFPAPVRLSPNCTRWRLSDIEAWEAKQEVLS